MGKMNIVNRNGRSLPECTQCEHRFETEVEPTYCTDKENKFVHCESCHEECEVD